MNDFNHVSTQLRWQPVSLPDICEPYYLLLFSLWLCYWEYITYSVLFAFFRISKYECSLASGTKRVITWYYCSYGGRLHLLTFTHAVCVVMRRTRGKILHTVLDKKSNGFIVIYNVLYNAYYVKFLNTYYTCSYKPPKVSKFYSNSTYSYKL